MPADRPSLDAEERRRLRALATECDLPWSTEDDGAIESANGGLVASMHPHASMHTVIARGEDYSSRQHRYAVDAANLLPAALAALDEADARLAAVTAERDRLRKLSESARAWVGARANFHEARRQGDVSAIAVALGNVSIAADFLEADARAAEDALTRTP